MLNMRSCWCNCGLCCSKSQRRSCFRGRLEQLLQVLVLLVLLQTVTAAGIWPQPRKPPPCSRVVFETFAFCRNTERRYDFKQDKVYFSYRVFSIASFLFSRTGLLFHSMCFLQGKLAQSHFCYKYPTFYKFNWALTLLSLSSYCPCFGVSLSSCCCCCCLWW